MAREFTDLITKIESIVTSDRNIRTALITTLAVHKPRIFQEGFDSKGVQIGHYSTKPASISKKEQARQTGKTFFEGGYAEYKRLIGKNPGFVILRNTDQMYADYGLITDGANYGFGFQNQLNYQKSKWMEDHFKKDIFSLSNNEINVLSDVLVDQLKNQL